ncbi:MAG: FAD-dependent thymidylate synthase [Nitrospira sp.]|nr:FAD-dependent thymidylate synthase [Nitrospira sp.]MDH4243408.1 FAD-dependent thymidylate synthase [Nitrospira sp.]MDH4354987.1 FAD-dependent thymidylate synthase [Nitrospira sp.]MDH5317028.1 FAD-dependent thymidylate synthase [Nitrospira sp.]
MSQDQSGRRVVAIAPMPPEKSAYALARYSRSPDSIEDSIRWVHGHSSEKFWEQFYFDYGHASIADLGHVIICFEEISELAAIRLEDEPLWDGQAKSSRYQNFASSRWFVPGQIRGSETEAVYEGILRSLSEIYRLLHDPLISYLSVREPRPEAMKPADYQRTIAARAFDVTRYLLPLAAKTNVGQVVSIRTLEKQITRLLSSQLPELRAIGEDLKDACQRAPVNLWSELCGQTSGVNDPLAPTLARHAKANDYQESVYSDLARHAKEVLRGTGLDQPSTWGAAETVELIDPHHPLDEIVATLLYRVSQAPYRKILDVVRDWSEKEKQATIEVATRQRGPYDDLIKEFRSGYAFNFDILMDIGAWRDMHRHRRCQQVQQNFTTVHGYDVPPPLVDAGLDTEYRQAMDAVRNDIELLKKKDQEASLYAIPFGFKVRCLFKMDYAEAEYIAKLRSGVKGHWSYRTVAWQMKQQISKKFPFLGEGIHATPPDVQDALTR